jgi:hypothetical protein
MRVEQEKSFRPITIILHTLEEAKELKNILNLGMQYSACKVPITYCPNIGALHRILEDILRDG